MTTVKKPSTSDAGASGAVVPMFAWIWFVVLGLVVIAVSTLGQFTSSVSTIQEVSDDNWIVATFGVGMGLLTIAIAGTAYRRGERWATWALAYYVVFFGVHIARWSLWIPDAGLLLLSVAALVAGRPRTTSVRTV
jgi:hypothetical protein